MTRNTTQHDSTRAGAALNARGQDLGLAHYYAHLHSEAYVWDDPETHRRLIERLCDEWPDGWAMSLPERFPMPGEHNPDCQVWGHAKGEMRKLAAAVERAARGGEG